MRISRFAIFRAEDDVIGKAAERVLPIAHPSVSPLSGLDEISRPYCLGLTPPSYCISPLSGLQKTGCRSALQETE